MRHQIRWTAEKIARRLELIKAQTYRQKIEIPPFRYKYLNDPLDSPPVAVDVDDFAWDMIQPQDYWANPRTNFILRTKFTSGDFEWNDGPIALSLPIGIAGDFSHPEALAYIDGEPLAACDRHHQEIVLPKNTVMVWSTRWPSTAGQAGPISTMSMKHQKYHLHL